MMQYEDIALSFTCHGQQLIGVLSRPQRAAKRGLLVIVGGPQYRAGSHRQFTLLARQLAARGIAVMRFDYRGMGDSEGETRDFEQIHDDIHAALDSFLLATPGLEEVALWGLCDGASAAMLYAHSDPRICGLALLNPWIRTAQGQAQTYLKHYYGQRLLQAEFWKKVFSGKFPVNKAVSSFIQQLRGAHAAQPSENQTAEPLPQRLLAAMQKFNGRTLVILSGQDLTAREFADVCALPQWKTLLRRQQISQYELPDADHTFSQRQWQDQVLEWTADWLEKI